MCLGRWLFFFLNGKRCERMVLASRNLCISKWLDKWPGECARLCMWHSANWFGQLPHRFWCECSRFHRTILLGYQAWICLTRLNTRVYGFASPSAKFIPKSTYDDRETFLIVRHVYSLLYIHKQMVINKKNCQFIYLYSCEGIKEYMKIRVVHGKRRMNRPARRSKKKKSPNVTQHDLLLAFNSLPIRTNTHT